MKLSRFFLFALILASLLWNMLYYNAGLGDWVILLVAICPLYIYARSFGIMRDMVTTLLLAVVFLSTVFIATFQFSSSRYYYNDYFHLALFGNRLFCESIIIASIFFLLRNKGRTLGSGFRAIPFKEKYVRVFLAFYVVFLVIGHLTGSLRMDSYWEARIVLPFHLNGIIFVYIAEFIPFLFAIIVENDILTKRKVDKRHIVYFILLGIIGGIVRLSKSQLFFCVIYFVIIILVYLKPKMTQLVRFGVPLFVLLVFSYSFFGLLRTSQSEKNSFSESIITAGMGAAEGETISDYNNPVVAAYNRLFMVGNQYMKSYGLIDENIFFDFSKVPYLTAVGGSSYIMTHEVDGYAEGAHHNSGSTGVMDALLFGGYGFCYMIMAILFLGASFVDSYRLRSHVSIRIILGMIVINLFMQTLLEPFLSGNSWWLRFIGDMAAVYVAMHFNFRKSKNTTEVKS